MVAITGNITESFDVTDWRVSAHKVKDGSLSGTATTSGSTYSVTCADTEPCNVTISPKIDKRWATGAWLYLNDLIVPTNPDATSKLYKVTTTPTGDVNYLSSSLKCHFDNNWTDVSVNVKTLTVYGTAALSSTWSKFGGYSAYFPGLSTAYVTVPDSDDFTLSGDFAIRFWMRPDNISGAKAVLAKTPNSAAGPFLIFQNGASLVFYASSNGSAWNIANGATIGTVAATTEYYVEISQVSGTIYTFLNGILGTSFAGGSLYNSTDVLTIGKYGAASTSYNYAGYIDDLEIIKAAGHTANYTPPTSAFLGVDGGVASATEPTWPSSGTVNETTAQGTVTYTFVANLDDAMFKSLGVKVPS